MILLVLFVTLVAFALLIYVSWWLLEILPKLALASLLRSGGFRERIAKFVIMLPDCLRRSLLHPWDVFQAAASGIGDRLRWLLLHAWNVICLRRGLVLVVVCGVVLVAALGCIILRPMYSATCVISVERDLASIE